MVAIVGGTGLGLFNSSLSQLNGYGSSGRSVVGQGRDQAYVNAATGNLVIQGQDDYLASLGLDLAMMRTYNSRGLLDGANNDGWTHWGSQRLLTPLPAAGATGTIVRVGADGYQATFTNIGTDLWRSTDGAGAHDTLQRVGSTWVYTEGSSRVTETYDANGRLSNAKDQDGNTQTYGYTGSQLTSITDTSGQITTLAYDANGNLLSIKTSSAGLDAIRVRYTYDTYNRLKTVEVDIGNADDTVRDADTQIFFTQYGYESTTSNRISLIQQGRKATVGGALTVTAELSVVYDSSGRVTELNTLAVTGEAAADRRLQFTYVSATQTTVTDGLGYVTTYTYDSLNRLTTVEAPAANGTRSTTHYVYDTDGNVSRVSTRFGSGATDFRITDYSYSNGNLTKIIDNAGNTIERTYSAFNQLLSETVYRTPDPDGAGAGVASDPVTTRYVYDGEAHLRYEISAEGRVTEHRYNLSGTRSQTRIYTADLYTATPFSEADLNAWVGAQTDRTQQQLTGYVYDFRGALSYIVRYPSVTAAGDGAGSYRQTFFVYGRGGELLETAELNGGLSNYIVNGGGLTGAVAGSWDLMGEQWRVTNKNDATAGQQVLTGTTVGQLSSSTSRIFRAEFTTGPTSAGREVAVGVSNNLLTTDAEYWRHLVLFEGNQIKALNTSGATTTATVLGTAKDSVTYVIEVVRTLTESKLYVYERGKSSSSGFVHTLSAIPAGTLAGWDQLKWHAYTVSGPTKTGAIGFLDNYAIYTSQPQTLVAGSNLTTYLYDGLGRMIATTDGAGGTTVTDYQDAANTLVTTAQNGLVSSTVYNKAGDVVQTTQSGAGITTATTSYRYDVNGRLRMATDATGGTVHYVYDERGWKVGEIGPDNRLTEYGYNHAGQLVTTLRYANAVTAALVSGGNPTSIALAGVRPTTHADDRTVLTQYYDAAGRLKYAVDAAGYITERVYDGAGRVTATIAYNSVLPAAANTLNLIYNNRALPANRDDTQNRITRNYYDKDGLLIGTLDAEGYLTEREHDKAGRFVRQAAYALQLGGTGATDTRSFSTLLTAAQAAAPDVAARNQTSRMLYDGLGRVVGTIDPAGYFTEYIYDRTGNKTDERRYSKPVVYEAAKTVINYRDEVRAQVLLDPTTSTRSYFQRTAYAYDGLNRIRGADEYFYEVNAAGADAFARVNYTTYSYNNLSGQLSQKTVAAELSTGLTERRATTIEYDTAGRVKRELSGIGSQALIALPTTATPAEREAIWTQYATEYGYDAAGRRIWSQDANDLKTVYYYDNSGRLRYSVNAVGEVTEITYTAFGEIDQTTQYAQRISTASLNGGLDNDATLTARLTAGIRSDANNRVTDLDYDARGLLKKKTDPLAFTIEQTYNAFGQIKDRNSDVGATPGSSKRLDAFSYDRKGLQTASVLDSATGGLQIGETLAYDAFGRVTAKTDGMGRQWQTEYDTLGRAVQTRDPLNQSTLTSYDAFSRTLTQTDKLGKVTSFAYDLRGKVITITTPEGIKTESSYDRHGKLTQVRLLNNGVWEATTYTYDRDGNLTRATDPNTFYTGSEYDKASRLTASIDKNGIRTTYTYDAANRVLTRTVDAGTVGAINPITGQPYLNLLTQYEYNAFGESIKVTDPEGVVTETVFDRKGQMAAVVVDTVQRANKPAPLKIATRYSYDAGGRRLTTNEGIQATGTSPVWNVSGAALRTTQYTYDKAGRLTKDIVDPSGLAITTEYGYDRNSNLAWKKDANLNAWRYVYDELNRRTHEVAPDGSVTESRFDAMGRVVTSIRYATPVLPPAQWPEGEAFKHPGFWSNNLSTSVDGLNVTASQTALVRDAATQRLVLTTQTMTTPTSAYAFGTREHSLATLGQVVFRGEITVEGTGGAYHLGMGQTTGGYKIHTAFFTGGRIRAYYDTGSTSGSVDLGAIEANVTYVVESVVGTSGSRLHIYKKGQSRYSGYVHEVVTAWTNPYLRMQVNGRTSGVAEKAYIDNLAEYLPVHIDAADQVTRYVYDADGRQVYQVDALGYVTESVYDAAGRVTETRRHVSLVQSADLPYMATLEDVASKLRYRTTLYSNSFRSGLGLFTLSGEDGIRWNEDALKLNSVPGKGPSYADGSNYYSISGDARYVFRGSLEKSGSSPGSYQFGVAANGKSHMVEFTDNQVRVRSNVGSGDVVTVLGTFEPGENYEIEVEVWAGGSRVSVLPVSGSPPESASSHTLETSWSGARSRIVVVPPASGSQSGGAWFDTYAEYDANQVNPAARRTRMSYDAGGRLISTTDAAGYTESYGYDKAGNRISLTNKLLNVWNYAYDAVGRLIEERAPAELMFTSTAGAGTKATVHKTTLIEYDKVGNLVLRREGYRSTPTSTFSEQRATRYFYDGRGLQIRTQYDSVSAYNAAADLLAGLGASTSQVQTSSNGQGVYDNAQTYHDARGQAILGIDQKGNLSYKVYDNGGRLEYEIDAERGVTRYTYDSFGNVRFLTRLEAKVPDMAGGSLATLETALRGVAIDTADRHTKALAAQAWVASHVRSMAVGGRVIEKIYDNLNRIVTVKEPEVSYFLAEGAGHRKLAKPTTQYRYDAFGNIIEQSVLRKADDFGAPLQWIVSYSQYDLNNRLTRQIDGGGYLTELGYNAFGEKASEVEYARKLQISAPPSNWNGLAALASLAPASSVGGNSLEGYDRRYSYTYDFMGRLSTQGMQGIQYSQFGTNNQMQEVLSSNLTIKTLQYDALGNITREIDSAGATTFRKYDKLGRVVATISPPIAMMSGNTFPLTTVGYDVLGNAIETIKYANGAWLGDDPTPRLASSSDQKTFLRYDKLGRVIEMVDAEGKSEYYAYDASGLLAKKWRQQTLAISGTATAGELYTYDRVGRQTEAIVLKRQADKGGVGIGTRNLYNVHGEVIQQGVFQHQYQLSGSTYSDVVTGSYEKTFDYDANGRLWRTNAENGVSTVYEHDLQGNATAKVVGVSAIGGSGIRTEMAYDLLGRVSSVKEASFTEMTPAASGSGLVGFNSRKITVVSITSEPLMWADPENGGYLYRRGTTHRAVLRWADMSALRPDYIGLSLRYSFAGIVSNVDPDPITFSTVDELGATVEWTDNWTYSDGEYQLYPSPGTVAQVTYAQAVSGYSSNNRLLSAPDSLYELTLDPSIGVSFNGVLEYRLASSAPNGSWSNTTLAVLKAGSAWKLALPAGTNGTYEYRIKLADSLANTLGSGRASLDPATPTLDTYIGTFQVSNGTVLSASTSSSAPSVTKTPIRSQTVDRWGNAISVTDPRDATIVTRYRYDHANRLVRTELPAIKVWSEAGGLSTAAFANFTQSYYDQRGLLIAEQDARGNIRKKTYGTAGELVYEYDALGNAVMHKYDGFGREIGSTDFGTETSKTYDRLNRLRTQSVTGAFALAAGGYTNATRETEYGYDELGNRIYEDNAANERTHYRYNTAGQVTDVLTPLAQGSLSSAYKRSYAYDRYGNKISDNDGVSTQVWQYNAFGKLLAQVDRAGANTFYTYDSYGRLSWQFNDPKSQIADQLGGTIWTHGQALNYIYYENGWLKEIIDTGSNAGTGTRGFTQRFVYDLAGNRTREQFLDYAGRVYQDNRIVYDELNRVTRVRDLRQVTEYGYDAAGNRVRSHARYLEGAILQSNGTQNTPAVWSGWYKYDAENRVIISQGVLNAQGQIDIRAKNGSTPAQGIKLAYDAAGNRRQMTQYNDATLRIYEYFYDAEHRLLRSVWKEDVPAQTNIIYDSEGYPLYDSNGNLQYQTVSLAYTRSHYDDYQYDAAGRRTEEKRWYEDARPNSSGVVTVFSSVQETRKTMVYNLNGWLTQQVQYKPNNTVQSTVYYSASSTPIATTADYYDAAGNLLQYRLSGKTYTYTYIRYGGGYKTSAIAIQGSYSPSGASLMSFDPNGNMTQVKQGAAVRSFVADSSGLIYQKRAGNTVSYYAYAGGRGIASFSTDPKEQDDFDFNYTAISDQYPASAPGRYVAQAGDSLRKIALAVWGDANLWYLIADANGLSVGGSDAVTEGTSLIIPSQAVNLANRSDTFKPYNESAIHGDLTPSLPPPKKKCGGFLAAIVVVVSVVVSVWFPPAIGLGAGATIGGSATLGAMATAAVGAAAGSIAGQLTGMALGIQDDFSWSAVGKSALTAALTAGLTRGIGGGLGLDKIEGGIGKFSYAGMAQGALNSVIGQGVGIALKQQEKFSWASMAASSLVKGASGKTGIGWLDRASDEVDAGTADFGQNFGVGFSTGLANRTIQAAFEGRGKVDVLNIAADAFGNAIGNSIVGEMRRSEATKQRQQQEANLHPDLRKGYDLMSDADKQAFWQQKPEVQAMAAAMAERRGTTSPVEGTEVALLDTSLLTQPKPTMVDLPGEPMVRQPPPKAPPGSTLLPEIGGGLTGSLLPLAVGGALLYELGQEYHDFVYGPAPELQGELVFGLGSSTGTDAGFGTPFTEQTNQGYRAYLANGGAGSIYDFVSSGSNIFSGGQMSLAGAKAGGGFPLFSSPGFNITGIGNVAIPGYTGPITSHVTEFYQGTLSQSYADAQAELRAGSLEIPKGVSERTVLGQRADALARANLELALSPGGQLEAYKDRVLVNQYLRDPSGSGAYRIPDIQIPSEGVILDGTIGYKDINTQQVRDFFRYSPTTGTVVIVTPTQPPLYIPRASPKKP